MSTTTLPEHLAALPQVRELKKIPFGGVHPDDCKRFTDGKRSARMPVPQEVAIPLSQHIGAPAKCIVDKKHKVKRGQVIGEAQGFVSCPVHATTSGEVVGIEPRTSIFGTTGDCVIIKADGKDEWHESCNQEEEDPLALDAKEIVARIRAAGMAGLGGATFPTHVKLSPPPNKPIKTLVVNGVECEPYLTCDHRLMLEHPREMLEGILYCKKVLNCPEVCIGIEANKVDCIELMARLIAEPRYKGFYVQPLHVLYPQGGEKQLILAALGIEVPSRGLPMDVGVVCSNVATFFAIYEAVKFRKPLIERMVTFTGPGIVDQRNYWVRIGTTFRWLLDKVGMIAGTNKIVAGGPMMGLSVGDIDRIVVKGVAGFTALNEEKVEDYRECIRCSACVVGCPAGLLPCELSILGEQNKWEVAQKNYNLLDCIQCGVCSYVCPSRRPIVHHIRQMMAEVAAAAKKKKH